MDRETFQRTAVAIPVVIGKGKSDEAVHGVHESLGSDNYSALQEWIGREHDAFYEGMNRAEEDRANWIKTSINNLLKHVDGSDMWYAVSHLTESALVLYNEHSAAATQDVINIAWEMAHGKGSHSDGGQDKPAPSRKPRVRP